MSENLREAFIAGFMATSEGYNGEYPGDLSVNARDEADKQYRIWACKRDGGHDWEPWECEDATHGHRLRCTRSCTTCPEGEWEFRPKDDEEAIDQ